MTTPSQPNSPEQRATTDVVVIGAGPVGENVAQYAVEGGLSATLVEHELLGGECSYYACIPSKALLRPADVVGTTRDLPGATRSSVDVADLLSRRDAWVSQYDDAGQITWAENAGITVFRGHGHLVGERLVAVDSDSGTRMVEARRAVVLATGSSPVIPPVFHGVEPWTSRDATGVQEIPERLVIVGGGVVACEAATWMTALGSRVTMLVRGDRLLSGWEDFAGQTVAQSLGDSGVDVRFGAEVHSTSRPDSASTGLGRIHGGSVALSLSDGSALEADEVLVATGRRPALESVGLDALGLAPEDVLSGELPGWLHTVGDASGAAPLTHVGKYHARVLGTRLAAEAGGRGDRPAPKVVPVPQAVFTQPQAASVGRTERQARGDGVEVVVSEVPYNAAAGTALLRDTVQGSAKIVVDRQTGALIGATFVGPDASEQLHAATVAVTGAVPVHVLRHAIPSFPTASELWLQLLEGLPADLR
ncbi:NAD(P)/FAD-dependent oxidoreductase [Kocuria sp. JC486]|uniref:dihydrolipoyl dehydrogenase family protein n=1 Tax=Kocuria sp. JC486 TaxID=1970736 RepID=UPI0014217205|nr:NAD(P)/FAD-dependent oxidoreductase [Kocuria sp. JC486]NHU84841.1 NAD(P)/FAD-dependent oxidoreductase [Kocuria sp. JC486]